MGLMRHTPIKIYQVLISIKYQIVVEIQYIEVKDLTDSSVIYCEYTEFVRLAIPVFAYLTCRFGPNCGSHDVRVAIDGTKLNETAS